MVLEGLMIVFLIVLFSILPIFTFIFYRIIRKKGKVYKMVGLMIFSLTTIGMVALAIKTLFGPSGFEPSYETIEIKQNIGGKLLCKSEYNADLHDWQYQISYNYITNNRDSINLGDGTYKGREWEKNEQLIKLGNWLILKTGSWSGSDRIILKNTLTDSLLVYNLNDEFIENDSLWKVQKIKSLLNYCCSESYIENISNGVIVLKYKFRTNENLNNLYDNRLITYQIESESGHIKMIKINK